MSERRKKLGCVFQPETDQTAGTTRSADFLSVLAEAEMKATHHREEAGVECSGRDQGRQQPGYVAKKLTTSRKKTNMNRIQDFDGGSEDMERRELLQSNLTRERLV